MNELMKVKETFHVFTKNTNTSKYSFTVDLMKTRNEEKSENHKEVQIKSEL